MAVAPAVAIRLSISRCLAGGELPAADPDDPNRKTWTLPTVFSPADKALYYSNQFVFRTRDRGRVGKRSVPI